MLHPDTVGRLAEDLGKTPDQINHLANSLIFSRGFYKVVHTDHLDTAHIQLTPEAAEDLRITLRALALRKDTL